MNASRSRGHGGLYKTFKIPDFWFSVNLCTRNRFLGFSGKRFRIQRLTENQNSDFFRKPCHVCGNEVYGVHCTHNSPKSHDFCRTPGRPGRMPGRPPSRRLSSPQVKRGPQPKALSTIAGLLLSGDEVASGWYFGTRAAANQPASLTEHTVSSWRHTLQHRGSLFAQSCRGHRKPAPRRGAGTVCVLTFQWLTRGRALRMAGVLDGRHAAEARRKTVGCI